MSLNTSAKSTYEPLKPGTYNAVCIGMVDVGTMTGPFGSQAKIWLQWEVDQEMDRGDRYTIGRLYTNSISSKAKLREHLEAWRGKAFAEAELAGFDLRNVLGAPCLLSVGNNTKDGRTYDSVDNVARMTKGMEPLKPMRELIAFDMDNPDATVLDKVPEWLRKHIEAAPEYTTAPKPDPTPETTVAPKPDPTPETTVSPEPDPTPKTTVAPNPDSDDIPF